MSDLLKKIVSVHVRLEGEVNSMWTVKWTDGTQSEFYAYESSPEYGDGPRVDHKVDQYEPELAQFLDEVSEFRFPEVPNPEFATVEFDYDPNTELVTNLKYELGKLTATGYQFTGLMVAAPTMYTMRRGCINSLDLVNGQLVAKGKDEWDVEKILHEMERRYYNKCIDFLNQRGSTEAAKEPLREWWGFGSLFLQEEAIKVKVEFSDADFTITLS